jgi:hypothetical protein
VHSPTAPRHGAPNERAVHGADVSVETWWAKQMSKAAISEMHGRCTGVLEEGEKIKLKIISIHELWRAAPDAKVCPAAPNLTCLGPPSPAHRRFRVRPSLVVGVFPSSRCPKSRPRPAPGAASIPP